MLQRGFPALGLSGLRLTQRQRHRLPGILINALGPAEISLVGEEGAIHFDGLSACRTNGFPDHSWVVAKDRATL